MDIMQAILTLAYLIIGFSALVFAGFLIFWHIRFFAKVPVYMKRIAEALEKIAENKRES